jgi:hypothetical protein
MSMQGLYLNWIELKIDQLHVWLMQYGGYTGVLHPEGFEIVGLICFLRQERIDRGVFELAYGFIKTV